MQCVGHPGWIALHCSSRRIPNGSVAWINCRCSRQRGAGDEQSQVEEISIVVLRLQGEFVNLDKIDEEDLDPASDDEQIQIRIEDVKPTVPVNITKNGGLMTIGSESSIQARCRCVKIFWREPRRSRWWHCKPRTSRTSPGRSCQCCTRSFQLLSPNRRVEWTCTGLAAISVSAARRVDPGKSDEVKTYKTCSCDRLFTSCFKEKEEKDGSPSFHHLDPVPHDVQVSEHAAFHSLTPIQYRIQTNEQDIFKMSETSSVNSDSEYPSRWKWTEEPITLF